MNSICVSIIIGLISGVISSGLVYCVTFKVERKRYVYEYCERFLFDALKVCEMYIPIESINILYELDPKNKVWKESVNNILDSLNPYGHEDKEMNDEEKKLFDNFIIAMKELCKYKPH